MRKRNKIARVNKTRTRARLLQSEHGPGIELLPKPFLRYFIGFDIEQGFWFAFITGIVIPIFLVPVVYDMLAPFVENPALRGIITVVIIIDGFAMVYLVFAYFFHPPVRLFITPDNNFALFCRDLSRPVAVGRVGDLDFSIDQNERSGWGEVRISGAGRRRSFLRLKSDDVAVVKRFQRQHHID